MAKRFPNVIHYLLLRINLVTALARQLYGIELAPSRAAELADELAHLDAASGAAGQGLAFDTACWSHAAVVNAWVAQGGSDDE